MVDVPSFTWSVNDFASTLPPASDASLNLRRAPSASPEASRACPSSMVPIHLGISGGAGAAAAESEGAGALGVGTTTLAEAAGTGAALCSTRV